MAMSNLTLKKNLTEKWIEFLKTQFADEDIMQVASGTLAFPTLDEESNERWIQLKVVIPKGSAGEEYDGYEEANSYRISCEEKAEKARKKAEDKAKKIASDKAKREAKKAEA